MDGLGKGLGRPRKDSTREGSTREGFDQVRVGYMDQRKVGEEQLCRKISSISLQYFTEWTLLVSL